MSRSFEALVEEAARVSVDGWDFSWLDGRATEERPSWGYQRLLRERLASARAALDIQTGGGEVLASVGVEHFPPTMVATEGWPANTTLATQRLHPLGVVVVADPDEPPLPFSDEAFDLVSSRHPVTVWWSEIARVLRPGGTYFAQHVGTRTNIEITEFLVARRSNDIGVVLLLVGTRLQPTWKDQKEPRADDGTYTERADRVGRDRRLGSARAGRGRLRPVRAR